MKTLNLSKAEFDLVTRFHASCLAPDETFNETEWAMFLHRRFGCELMEKYRIKVVEFSPDDTLMGMVRGGRITEEPNKSVSEGAK